MIDYIGNFEIVSPEVAAPLGTQPQALAGAAYFGATLITTW